jgi:hypothetical protein
MWPFENNPWEQTPKWHWRYWFGWQMRCWDWTDCYTPEDGAWRYRSYGQHARIMFEEMCYAANEETPTTSPLP